MPCRDHHSCRSGTTSDTVGGADPDALSPVRRVLATWTPLLSPFLSTALLCLAERAKGPASKYAPYFASLPASADCLLMWGREERSVLSGTSIEDAGIEPHAMFASKIAPLMEAFPQHWPAPFNTYEAFRVEASLVQSRAFHMEVSSSMTRT